MSNAMCYLNSNELDDVTSHIDGLLVHFGKNWWKNFLGAILGIFWSNNNKKFNACNVFILKLSMLKSCPGQNNE